MDIELVRLFVRQVLEEEKNKNLLGEPDTTTEKHRDEPQPQYEEEEDGADADEASSLGGMGAGLGPMMPLTYDPEKPTYDPYEREKKKK